MSGGPSHKSRRNPRTLSRIKALERTDDRTGVTRRETWSFVDVDGERKVLFETREGAISQNAEQVEQRFLTLRGALRGPRQVARQIWLSLED